MKIESVAIGNISVPSGRRMPTDERVESLARSMEDVGLLHPPTLSEDFRVIAGRTRLLAAKKLKWTHIPARILKADALHAELAEIVENIERSQLTALEEAVALKRMKEIYLVLHPQTKHGGAPGSAGGGKLAPPDVSKDDRLSSFAQTAASGAGQSARSVQRSVAVAENLTDLTKTQITGTRAADSKAELARLAELPPEQQEKVAMVLGKGKIKTVTEAKKAAGVEPKPKPGAQKKDPRIWQEIEQHLGKALNRVDSLNKMYPNKPLWGTLLMQIKQSMRTLKAWKESVK